MYLIVHLALLGLVLLHDLGLLAFVRALPLLVLGRRGLHPDHNVYKNWLTWGTVWSEGDDTVNNSKRATCSQMGPYKAPI